MMFDTDPPPLAFITFTAHNWQLLDTPNCAPHVVPAT